MIARLFFALLALGLAARAHAANPLLITRDADSPYPTIQAAIDAAPAGATIRIGPGEYPEELRIEKPLTLEGAGWQRTIIRSRKATLAGVLQLQQDAMERARTLPADQHPALVASFAEQASQMPALRIRGAADVTVRALKLAGDPGNPDENFGMADTIGLLRLENARIRLEDCAVVGSPGAGILLLDGSRARIHRSLVAAAWSTGIIVGGRSPRGESHLDIADSDVRNCCYAGILISPGQQATIQRSRISGAAWHGIRYDDASPTITGNRIFGNARCGIYASGKTAAVVRDNLFAANESVGIACWFSNADIIARNTFADNLRDGLAVLGASAPTVEQNIFANQPVAIACSWINDPSSPPGAVGAPVLRDNLFWRNQVQVQRTVPGPPPATQPGTTIPDIDPGFLNAAAGDYTPTITKSGAASPPPLTSPFPLQPEESTIIPEGPTRDSRAWKHKK